jgi:hypothetical protein
MRLRCDVRFSGDPIDLDCARWDWRCARGEDPRRYERARRINPATSALNRHALAKGTHERLRVVSPVVEARDRTSTVASALMWTSSSRNERNRYRLDHTTSDDHGPVRTEADAISC